MQVNDLACKLCYVGFKHPPQLERHKDIVHKGELGGFDLNLSAPEMNFSCKKCEKKFWSAKSLEYHTEVNHPRFCSAKRQPRKKNTTSVINSAIIPARQENFQYNYMFDFVNTRRGGQ